MKKIGFIGGGNMGSAIMSRIYQHYSVCVCEKDKKKVQQLRRKYRIKNMELPDLVRHAQVIVLAVKPQDSGAVLKDVRRDFGRDKLLISIAAGLTTGFLEKRLPPQARVVRTMPNMPALIAEGVTAICPGKQAKAADILTARRIFKYIGATEIVQEKWMNAVTAVSGSGPAYVFLFAECFMKAAQSLGLSRDLSRLLVSETLKGSVDLLLQSQDDAAQLRAKVTSKGGTTQAATEVFMKHRLDKIYDQALKAAEKRARQLSQ